MKARMRDGSGFRHFRYVKEDVDRYGIVRLYLRRKGQRKIRLYEKPGTPEFEQEYQRALAGHAAAIATVDKGAPALPGSLKALCQAYYTSTAFLGLGASTRNARRGILEAICQARGDNGSVAGHLPVAAMEPGHVAKLRDQKATTPEAANGRVKALRQLFAWAIDPEVRKVRTNPAREVKYLRAANPDGFRVWTEEDVLRYEARHPIGTAARLALDLFLYTGVRRSDVVKLGPQMERWVDETQEDGTVIRVSKLIFSETKGAAHRRKVHELRILPPLRASIDATETGHLVYLPTMFGHPRSINAFGHWFKRRCLEAGISPGLSAHGLRKLGAQRVVEAGATEAEVMALFGWESSRIAAIYIKKANRARLEDKALTRLMGTEAQQKWPTFPRVTPAIGQKGPKR